MSKTIQTIALGLDRPILDSATELLLQKALRADGFLDLSFAAVAVPTAEAGRLLRENLASAAVATGGVLPPKVILPERLCVGSPANEAVCFAAWIKVLREAKAEDYPELLPLLENARTDAEKLYETANGFQQCRAELAAAATTLAEARDKLDSLSRSMGGAALEHACRFREFAALEKCYLNELGDAARDPAYAGIAAAKAPETVAGCTFFLALGCSDVSPLFRLALKNLAESGVEVVVAVHADSASRFDAFGAPDPDYWNSVPLDVKPETNCRRFASVADEVAGIALLMGKTFRPGTVGAAGDDLRKALLDRESGVHFCAPQKHFLRSSAPGILFAALLALDSENPSYEAIGGLLHHDLILRYAETVIPEANTRRMATELDRRQHEALFTDAASLRKCLRGHSSDHNSPADNLLNLLDILWDFAKKLHRSEKPLTTAYEFFATIGGAAGAGLAATPDTVAQLSLLGQLIVQSEEAAGGDRDLALALFRGGFAKAFAPDEPQELSGVEVVGFRELEWRRDEQLVVGGMNAENFDYGKTSDAFLPECAKKLLQLPAERERYASDACRMYAICEERRRNGGSITFFCSAGGSAGEALKPAKFFFHCAPAELPHRIQLFFGGKLDVKLPRFSTGTRPHDAIIQLRSALPDNRMSITSFKSYLACPFRYYLEHILGGSELDDRAPEFDNMQFGTIAHKILEDTCRDCADPEPDAIEHFALSKLAALKHRLFERRTAALAELQFELLEQNLHYFAREQSRILAEGWKPCFLECKVAVNWDEFFRRFFPAEPAGGTWRKTITLVGKLDRVDRLGDTNRYRVIDYKTNKDGGPPAGTHFAKLKTDEDEKELFRRAPDSEKGAPRKWADLQLPLYCALVESGLIAEFSGPAEAAYFNLPLAFAETGLAPFPELESRTMIESAVRCADAVLNRIYVRRVFWPPNPQANSRFDTWRPVLGSMERTNFILPDDWEAAP